MIIVAINIEPEEQDEGAKADQSEIEEPPQEQAVAEERNGLNHYI